ncbi:MAG: DUF2231 domain-containing protein [Pedobacter sp.]|nr:MAG: DUF2231 domain-containing protein [Pedobacter sp.]
MLDVFEFLGRFHPLLVHLPIGILLIAVVFRFMSWKNTGLLLSKALNVSVAIGSIAAVFSCITGYLLSQSAEYDEKIVWWHQWLGIGVAIISVAWYYQLRKSSASVWSVVTAGSIFVLLMITGHLGGSLTHGEDYLSFGPVEDTTQTLVRQPIENVQQAVAYTEIVKPILSTSCYSCHSEKKQKGKLRLDLPEHIIKGGKNGDIIDTASLSESELIKRLLLPLSDKKHMPPKDKKQLTRDELSLLHWWVESGASFNKKVSELTQEGKIVPVIAALEKPQQLTQAPVVVPPVPVSRADQSALDTLRKIGVVVLPVSSESNYLSANFVSTDSVNDADMKLLIPISKQLVSLKAGDTKITDSALSYISKCTNLMRLQLQQTAVTDKGLAKLTALKDLQELNLVGTSVTANGIINLKNLKGLRNIYLYQTPVMRSGWRELQTTFPSVHLDSGGYVLPVLASDTSLVKPKKKL